MCLDCFVRRLLEVDRFRNDEKKMDAARSVVRGGADPLKSTGASAAGSMQIWP